VFFFFFFLGRTQIVHRRRRLAEARETRENRLNALSQLGHVPRRFIRPRQRRPA